MARVLSSLTLLFFALSCNSPAEKPPESAAGQEQTAPAGGLTNYDLASVEALRTALEDGDDDYQPAYERMIRRAEEALNDKLYTVLEKTVMPPSGDKHDYVSLAPYWWPDPNQPDGLPWIRKDGEVNPATKDGNTDDRAKDRAFGNIDDLGMAAYFSGEDKYAERAVEQLNAWFVDPATRMNPNLNYGQGIPGLNDGRCFGIIETTSLQGIVTALELLDLEDQLPPATKSGMKDWFAGYVNWLQTSELGIEEGTRTNNHATWYDVQVVGMLRYLGRDDEARAVLEAAKAKRVAVQIEPDGSQPEELARTKSVGYSRMNLAAMTRLAWHGRQLGVDLWNYQTEDGRGIRGAYDYLKPFAFEDKLWTYQQLGSMEKSLADVRRMFYRTGAMMEEESFCALRSAEDGVGNGIEDFLFTCP
jgi:hypothetical protein